MNQHPRTDPLLDEVRRNREQLLRACGGSLDSLYDMLKRCEALDARKIVKSPQRTDDSSEHPQT
jgi:hypothetical protein